MVIFSDLKSRFSDKLTILTKILMIFIATGGIFNLMGFLMASRPPGNEKQRCFSLPEDREAIENPIRLRFC
jgi:hypothetical protein